MQLMLATLKKKGYLLFTLVLMVAFTALYVFLDLRQGGTHNTMLNTHTVTPKYLGEHFGWLYKTQCPEASKWYSESPHENWKHLGTDDGWVPIDMNDRGDVVGWAWIDSISRPWIRFYSGKVVLLPYIIEHHTTPSSINNVGQIVGTATADHGWHVILWQPEVGDLLK